MFVPFNEFIRIDRRKSEAIFLQIAYQFIQAVQRGIIAVDAKLPGTRVISQELKVHRKTVVAAFQELQAQGWVEIIPNVGIFTKNPQVLSKNHLKSSKNDKKPTKTIDFRLDSSYTLSSPFEKTDCRLQFDDGHTDIRLFNTKELYRFYNNAFQRKSILQQLGDYSRHGNTFFKEQLSYYLNLTQGFHIGKDQLVTGKSKELLIYILSQVLIKTGDVILTGSFGYFGANMIFQQAGAQIKPIPVDDEGIDVDYIQKHFSKNQIRCIYLNPRSQYPTTVKMSSKRRSELLNLADTYEFLIIEDDADAELYFESTVDYPMATTQNRVIYLGSFAPYFPPAFQVKFLLASQVLIDEVVKYLGILYPQGDIILEQALAEIIKEGDIHRYARKANKIYKKRLERFDELLRFNFGKEIRYKKPVGGLSYWVEFKQEISLHQLGKACQKDDLFIPRICMYQNAKTTALKLGFGRLNEQEMAESLAILHDNWKKLVSS
ncbi:MAG: PLP-dependent aminotransferase family protein [Brumimicrobium sp.]|nr:PLP-dependent aminotransferase family protein [Brumimicrobium sp.]